MMLIMAPPGEHDHASRVDAADAGLSQGGRRCGKENNNRQTHHLSYHNPHQHRPIFITFDNWFQKGENVDRNWGQH